MHDNEHRMNENEHRMKECNECTIAAETHLSCLQRSRHFMQPLTVRRQAPGIVAFTTHALGQTHFQPVEE
jgi:hypothetical protein